MCCALIHLNRKKKEEEKKSFFKLVSNPVMRSSNFELLFIQPQSNICSVTMTLNAYGSHVILTESK